MRHNDKNKTFITPLGNEAEALADTISGRAALGTELKVNGEHVEITLELFTASARLAIRPPKSSRRSTRRFALASLIPSWRGN